jgi:hypothetical protein
MPPNALIKATPLSLNPPRASHIAPQIHALWSPLFPSSSSSSLTSESERQVPGVGQVLVTEDQRATLAVLVEDAGRRSSNGKRVDWRRSRARREMLIRLGIPIDLDEVCDPFLFRTRLYLSYRY